MQFPFRVCHTKTRTYIEFGSWFLPHQENPQYTKHKSRTNPKNKSGSLHHQKNHQYTKHTSRTNSKNTVSRCYARAWRRAGPRESWTWKRRRQDTRHPPLYVGCVGRGSNLKDLRREPRTIEYERKREREKERPKLQVYLYVNMYRECYNAA